ncbi:GNAT family N-acetyltransferase [Jeongeupia naejangsanensis]|uniref:N-acetyltransferase n=1 Tax=Jeongeupia naejangsanensis TaxID=613195 RepID=A0ABS2BFP2_9NEIS|nr:N-acetyltransferase [Jeongeupia naejangsanensis]MBM3114433.1 N-acetyltransferase [Jeongeupia naejangsanensis]
MTFTIRPAGVADAAAIDELVTAAFGQPGEAGLVAALNAAGRIDLELVAEAGGLIVGHVLFSPMTVEGVAGAVTGLAPLSVAADWRRQGLGKALVDAGLAQLQAKGVVAAVVLGDPAYYGRFGFVRADRFGLSCEYEVPPEYFMALELVPGALDFAAGVARYAPEFATL